VEQRGAVRPRLLMNKHTGQHVYYVITDIYLKIWRFLARSMKTKELLGRYPRKISLLKDLKKGYPYG
jgi:hypothetical protein